MAVLMLVHIILLMEKYTLCVCVYICVCVCVLACVVCAVSSSVVVMVVGICNWL